MRNLPLAHLSRKHSRAANHLLLLFIALLTLSSTPAAQAQAERRAAEEASAASGAPGSITGRIVGEDGRPAVDVQVYLYGAYLGIPPRGAMTDSAGRFQFNELQPGLYTLRAISPAFIEAPDESRTPWEPRYFRPGDSAQLTLVKGGVITGTVLTAQGEAVTGASIRVIRVRDAQGRRILAETFGGMLRITDDRGVYRIYGLQPGSYLVMVNGNTFNYFGGPGIYSGDTPTYYPSSTRDTATEVPVRAAEEATGVDIRYRGERGNIVSGTISGAASITERNGYVSVVLTRVGTGLIESQGGTSPIDGKFAFSLIGIPEGEYELSAQAFSEPGDGMGSAPRRITIRGADLTGLELSLAPLASIAGRVTLEPLQRVEACAKLSPQAAMRQTLITARLEGQDKERLQAANFSSGGGVPNEQGEFLIRNLSGGLFRMNIRLPGHDWYLHAISFPPATRAAEDKSSDAKAAAAPQTVTGILAVKRGERASGINITVAQGAASLRGRAAPQAEGTPLPSNLRVYLVPVERERADDILRYAETNLAADGSFAFNSLAPGRYLLALRPIAPQTDITQPPRMLAWDEEGRRALRREAEAANNALELKPCQQLKDYTLSYAAK